MSPNYKELTQLSMKMFGTYAPRGVRFDTRLTAAQKAKLFDTLRTAYNAPELPLELAKPEHVLAWFESHTTTPECVANWIDDSARMQTAA